MKIFLILGNLKTKLELRTEMIEAAQIGLTEQRRKQKRDLPKSDYFSGMKYTARLERNSMCVCLIILTWVLSRFFNTLLVLPSPAGVDVLELMITRPRSLYIIDVCRWRLFS